MEKVTELVKQLLENKSLTIFLGIVIVAMFLGWVGGGS